MLTLVVTLFQEVLYAEVLTGIDETRVLHGEENAAQVERGDSGGLDLGTHVQILNPGQWTRAGGPFFHPSNWGRRFPNMSPVSEP